MRRPELGALLEWLESSVRSVVAESRRRVESILDWRDDEDDGQANSSEQHEDVTSTEGPRVDWRLRAWDDPELEQRWLNEGVIAISRDEIGDLTSWPGDDALRHRLERALEERGDPRTDRAYSTFVRYWRSFRLDMKPGDRVAVPLTGRRVAIGEIVGDYEYVEQEPEPRVRHIRRVRWLARCDRSDLDEALRRVVNAPGTIGRINKANLDGFG